MRPEVLSARAVALCGFHPQALAALVAERLRGVGVFDEGVNLMTKAKCSKFTRNFLTDSNCGRKFYCGDVLGSPQNTLRWANFCGRKRNPGNFPGFNGQGGPNRRAAMAEHAAGGRTRSPTGLLRSARDLHFDIPTF